MILVSLIIKNFMKKNGFTLIELLVVIAIIGILATLAVVSLQGSRARARDTRRLSDVKQISTALAMYQNDNQVYPTSITPGGSIGTGTSIYMATVPAPPIPDDGCTGSDKYTYSTQTNNSSYTINYCLGAPNNNLPAGLGTMTPAGIVQ
jgi:prepilin-type N-terminal cleavage/methylation domain-containing protein